MVLPPGMPAQDARRAALPEAMPEAVVLFFNNNEPQACVLCGIPIFANLLDIEEPVHRLMQ